MPGNWKKKTFVQTIFQISTWKVLLLLLKICLLWKTWPISVKRWKPVWIRAWLLSMQDFVNKTLQLVRISLLISAITKSSAIFLWEVIAKFIVSHCVFCKLQRKLGFFCSINHLSGPLWKQMFPCDCCILIHFVCFCVSRFTACHWTVSGNDRLVFFKAFYDLSYSCLLQE